MSNLKREIANTTNGGVLGWAILLVFAVFALCVITLLAAGAVYVLAWAGHAGWNAAH